MEMVGAVKPANLLRKIVAAFGGSILFDRKERCAEFDRIWDKNCRFAELLSECDDIYFKSDFSDQILDQLTEYMRSHPQEFVLKGDFEFFDN